MRWCVLLALLPMLAAADDTKSPLTPEEAGLMKRPKHSLRAATLPALPRGARPNLSTAHVIGVVEGGLLIQYQLASYRQLELLAADRSTRWMSVPTPRTRRVPRQTMLPRPRVTAARARLVVEHPGDRTTIYELASGRLWGELKTGAVSPAVVEDRLYALEGRHLRAIDLTREGEDPTSHVWQARVPAALRAMLFADREHVGLLLEHEDGPVRRTELRRWTRAGKALPVVLVGDALLGAPLRLGPSSAVLTLVHRLRRVDALAGTIGWSAALDVREVFRTGDQLSARTSDGRISWVDRKTGKISRVTRTTSTRLTAAASEADGAYLAMRKGIAPREFTSWITHRSRPGKAWRWTYDIEGRGTTVLELLPLGQGRVLATIGLGYGGAHRLVLVSGGRPAPSRRVSYGKAPRRRPFVHGARLWLPVDDGVEAYDIATPKPPKQPATPGQPR